MSSHAIYICRECDYLYDQAKGGSEAGIAPGTDIDALSEDRRCPDYAKGKSYLVRVI
jgi:rubredoxin-NAD+ reductase